MASTYQNYLGANVLHEGKVVNYRSLSRALKVHVNSAKEMLYDFYQVQNSGKPGSVHATYLLCGVAKPAPQLKTNGTSQSNGDDIIMHDASIPFSSSMPESQDVDSCPVAVTTFSLAAQERLQEIKLSYESITSIHLYSIEPGPLSNIHILSECNRTLVSNDETEDPQTMRRQCGTIFNPTSKRRAIHRVLPTGTSQQASTAAMKSANPITELTASKEVPAQSTASSATNPGQAVSKPSTKKSKVSDIFSSFSKAVKKEVKSENEVTTDVKDAHMSDAPLASEDEGDEDALNSSGAEMITKLDTSRKSKAEIEATLRKMMEEDSDSDDIVKTEKDDETMEGIDPQDGNDVLGPSTTLDSPITNQQEAEVSNESQEQVTTSNGRRRGRRRVMKKRRIKDADGYLITKEEPVWESFSEDETKASEHVKSASPAVAASGSNKSKKAAGASKPGQGNIMSFFGKK